MQNKYNYRYNKMNSFHKLIFLFFIFSISELNAEPIYGVKGSVQKIIPIQRFTQLEVSGPIYFTLESDEWFNRCSEIRLFGDGNLLPYIKVENTGETLRITTTAPIIPTKWIYASVNCIDIKSINALSYSNIVAYSIKANDVTVKINGGAVSLKGEAKHLDAVIEQNGFLTLELLEVDDAKLKVNNGGLIYTGIMHAHYEAEATGTGEIHFFAKDHPKDYKKELAPGVYLRAKDHRHNRDERAKLNFKDYDRVRKKMVDAYVK